MSDEKNIGDALGDVLAEIVPLAAMRDWTDAQWAEHDARVAAERAKLEPVVLPRAVAIDLGDLGWPARAVIAARSADLARPAAARILAHDFERRNAVVLSGPAGCGKTVAAAAWALALGRRVRFVRASTFAASSRYDAAQRALWYEAEALVLDDLGAEYLDAKGSFKVDLDELVDTFYGDLRPLVITTNSTIDQCTERYGERVTDRLRECAAWLSVNSQSLRRKP